MANTLFLRLEGPMQAWGERARWSVRDTAAEPTKSGVIGLLACALGLRQDEELRNLSQAMRMGVRCDRPGRQIVDYHTVGAGYGRPMLLSAQGKPKISSGRPHTEETWRHYLCDASFLVALQAESDLVASVASALRAPFWPIYLGRKSCVPSRPPFDGVGTYDSLSDALRNWRPLETPVRAILECSPSRPGATRRSDEIISRTHRIFAPRYTCEERLFTQDGEEKGLCISHD
ncbi:MAG: type I-E CRISPR-associated protein Cas5/CasD [Anaerolineae bacterium]